MNAQELDKKFIQQKMAAIAVIEWDTQDNKPSTEEMLNKYNNLIDFLSKEENLNNSMLDLMQMGIMSLELSCFMLAYDLVDDFSNHLKPIREKIKAESEK